MCLCVKPLSSKHQYPFMCQTLRLITSIPLMCQTLKHLARSINTHCSHHYRHCRCPHHCRFRCRHRSINTLMCVKPLLVNILLHIFIALYYIKWESTIEDQEPTIMCRLKFVFYVIAIVDHRGHCHQVGIH